MLVSLLGLYYFQLIICRRGVTLDSFLHWFILLDMATRIWIDENRESVRVCMYVCILSTYLIIMVFTRSIHIYRIISGNSRQSPSVLVLTLLPLLLTELPVVWCISGFLLKDHPDSVTGSPPPPTSQYLPRLTGKGQDPTRLSLEM